MATASSSSWFSGSDPEASRPPVKDVVKTLYQSTSSRYDRSPQEKSRFSTLLLEYGERHLQDWAVVASSEAIASVHGASSRGGGLTGSSGGRSQGALPNPAPRKTQWNQSGRIRNKKVMPHGNGMYSSTNSGTGTQNGKTIAGSHASEVRTMRKIEGRLHLCSRSLVFEPHDKMRAVIRCPFDRMDKPPMDVPVDQNQTNRGNSNSSDANSRQLPRVVSSSNFLSGSYEAITPLTIELFTQRHYCMMENNLVGPSDSVSVPTAFRFTFLHSAPESFVELCSVRQIMDTIES